MQLIKQRRHESRHLRDSAKGQPCFVRLPGICNHDPDTTRLCHLNGGGAGTKHSDLMGAFACSSCHAEIDRRTIKCANPDYVKLLHLQGMVRTQQYWLDVGLVVLK